MKLIYNDFWTMSINVQFSDFSLGLYYNIYRITKLYNSTSTGSTLPVGSGRAIAQGAEKNRGDLFIPDPIIFYIMKSTR